MFMALAPGQPMTHRKRRCGYSLGDPAAVEVGDDLGSGSDVGDGWGGELGSGSDVGAELMVDLMSGSGSDDVGVKWGGGELEEDPQLQLKLQFVDNLGLFLGDSKLAGDVVMDD